MQRIDKIKHMQLHERIEQEITYFVPTHFLELKRIKNKNKTRIT